MADGSLFQHVRALRAADLFCGAGGTSTGAARAVRSLGGRLHLTAVNHWPVALETHSAMHPDAEHICADLESVRPREVIPEGRLDLLMASPTCTFHSRARGGRPVHDQQRMDPWHVHRWCCELRVARLLVENVPEFVDWGPCSLVTGRPIQSRRGEYFRAWCDALRAIGFRLDWRVLNCADYGDPTTRQRFFLVGRTDGRALRWPEPTHARGGAADLLGQRAPWRSAGECIDWSHPGRSIFQRKRPLAPNTIRRLLAGAQRYGWPRQHIEALQALLEGREPLLLIDRAAAETMLGLVMAIGSTGAARSINEPLPTITTGGNGARPHYARPVILSTNNSGRPRGAFEEPFPTITTGGAGCATRPGNARPAIAQPIIAPYYGSGSGLSARGAHEPMASVTTKARLGPGRARHRVHQQQQQPGHSPRCMRTAAHHHHGARRRYGGGVAGGQRVPHRHPLPDADRARARPGNVVRRGRRRVPVRRQRHRDYEADWQRRPLQDRRGAGARVGAAMNGVDHVRVQRIQNSLLCCPLSARARWMLERIADGSMPPILIEGWWPPNSEFFGEGARAFEEFEGAYQELDDRGLIAVGDLIEEEEKKIDGADEFRFQYWVTLRLAFDLPHRGKGLLP